MIKTNLGIYSVDDTVTRPILVTTTQDILEFLGLPKTIYTLYDPKDTLFAAKTKLGTLSSQLATYDEVVKVEYTEVSEENNELSRIPATPDFLPIYIDNDIGSSCVPVYHRRKVNIAFKYFSKSQSKVTMLINKLRLTTSTDSMYRLHNLEYSMILNSMFLKLLINIVELKNKRLSTPITLENYLTETFDSRIDLMNSLDGNSFKREVAIREAQNDVIGYIIDDLHTLNAEVDEANNMFGVVFNYEFTYDKPVSYMLWYPFLVYNSLINKEFRNFIKDTTYSNTSIRTKGSKDLMELTTRPNSYLTVDKSKYYVSIPREDIEVMPRPQAYTARVLVLLLILDDQDLTYLLNIKTEIPHINFKDCVLEFLLKSEREHINDLGDSIFHFELFKNGKKDYTSRFILSEDGSLRTVEPLDIKATYKLSISIVADTAILNKDAKNRIKAYLNQEIIDISGNTITCNTNNSAHNNDSFVESHLTLLSIPIETIVDNIKVTKYEDIIFTIQEYHWAKYFTKEIVLNISGYMKEK